VCTHVWFAGIIWIDELFKDWYKCDVMWCILESCWIEILVCHMCMRTIDIGMLVGIRLCVTENMIIVDDWDVNFELVL